MYIPDHYAEPDPAILLDLMAANPLGALISNGPDGLDANHIPFLHEPAPVSQAGPGRLIGHVARANPLWQAVEGEMPVLVLFRAGDGYVSPNWYPSKHRFHRQVPTWNYQIVNVHGRLRVHDDPSFVRGVVARLTSEHERRIGESKPWKMGESSAEFIDSMLAAIVGIEVCIDRIVGKVKLSQNKSAEDRGGAIERLRALGNNGLADAMSRTLPEQTG